MLCCFVVWKARHTFRRQTRRREPGILANAFYYFFLQKALYLVRSMGMSCSEDRKVPKAFKLKNDDLFLLLKNELLFVLFKKL